MSPAGSGGRTRLFAPHPVAHFPRQGAGAEPEPGSSRSARAGAPPPLSQARPLPCAPTAGIFSITSPPVPASLQEPVGWARELASRLLGPGKAGVPRDGGSEGKEVLRPQLGRAPSPPSGGSPISAALEPGEAAPPPRRDTKASGIWGPHLGGSSPRAALATSDSLLGSLLRTPCRVTDQEPYANCRVQRKSLGSRKPRLPSTNQLEKEAGETKDVKEN